ncbi:hypothetical protein RINTHM_8700 [Richelia intracellularis HM01]|nr:hypothetical protein RINTHM_8700 [Richelia intracellularis HM01]
MVVDGPNQYADVGAGIELAKNYKQCIQKRGWKSMGIFKRQPYYGITIPH